MKFGSLEPIELHQDYVFAFRLTNNIYKLRVSRTQAVKL